MRLVLTTLLMLAATPAWAEWVKYDENERGIFYFDPATIRKDGNLRKAWESIDHKNPGESGERSARLLIEYDCKKERYRRLSGFLFSGPMVSGDILVSSSAPGAWDYPPPGTPAETILKLVCSR